MFERALALPEPGVETFFLWGPRQTGKEHARDHLQGLRSLVQDHPRVGRRIAVCREPRARTTDDGIEILPALTFVRRLWQEGLT
jgi:hypothetical protein